MNAEDVESALVAVSKNSHDIDMWMKNIATYFSIHPSLALGKDPVIHSVRSRLKSSEHLREKIGRKASEGVHIDGNTVFAAITDLAGVRLLHLHQEQARCIHEEILDKVHNKRDWVLGEVPKAYTWDPESKEFFLGLGLEVLLKDTFYTSVHYLVRPRADSKLCCEIQVRTLFEEIWGEVDHLLNYPVPTEILACREQLRVLSKVVGAGSRLVDSIFRTIATPQHAPSANLSSSAMPNIANIGKDGSDAVKGET